MWFRFVFFPLCYLVVVNCIPQSDTTVGQDKNSGTYVSLSENRRNEQIGFSSDSAAGRDRGKSISGNERQSIIPNAHETSNLGHKEESNLNGRGSSIGQPIGESNQHFNNRETETRPGSWGRPTGESEQTLNNEEHISARPAHSTIDREDRNRPSVSRPGIVGEGTFEPPSGGSGHTTNHRESENRPSVFGGNSFERPIGSSHVTDHREGERRPTGFNTGGDAFGRPTGGSSHPTDHREGERFGESSFGRPTGGSSHVTDHKEDEHRPSGFNAGGDAFGRPTGGPGHPTAHRESESRPSGSRPGVPEHQFGRPIESLQTGFKPANQEQSFGGATPGSNKRPTEQNQFSNEPNTETEFSNPNGNENDKDGKEEEKDICFTHLGCFKMGKPWKSALRPVGVPDGPEKIQTTILFYSRDNLERPQNIIMYPEINMGEARFDPKKITAIMVHGFANSGNATWLKDMKNVYLKKVDANVMIVDWGKGAQLLNYFQVAGNTRVVGKQLGVFLKLLIEKYGADPGRFHLIGHSLGAQICSYVGKEVQGIARLTALDPAQPAFEGFDREVRLDKSDAEFVDVVHTDARPFIPTLGFGMIAPCGHVDFYMNGGFDQPGCVPPAKKDLPAIKNVLDLAKYPVEVIARTVACPHSRAYEYLIESFNETENCIFWGHKADVKNVLKSVTNTVTQGLLKKFTALSSSCSKEDCIPLGFATKKSPLRGVFVVTTNNRQPYCISEPGIPPEAPPQERNHESFIQKIGKKTRVTN